jgi:hypothetical protein
MLQLRFRAARASERLPAALPASWRQAGGGGKALQKRPFKQKCTSFSAAII